MSEPMKVDPDHENEHHDVHSHSDGGARCVMTPLLQLPAPVAQHIVGALCGLVRTAHTHEAANPTPAGQLTRAQTFEEGFVYMAEPPFEGYFADRYIMDFYDVRDRQICSRMHLHTGLRFVRMMTGPDTTIRVSSLSPFEINPSAGWTGENLALSAFADVNPPDPGDEWEQPIRRYNAVVPPCSWVDMQIPRGVSHQFNAVGPHAVIDSVHPEESIETLRESMSGYKMMAQTIFLARELPAADTCIPTAPAA